MRILGPNCLGIIVPGISLNASFAASTPQKGHIGFISQSGALCTSVLDWAIDEGIGFSYFVSVGNMLDVSMADLIDYFGSATETRSIILYIESLAHAREFMSATRAFSRTKPIVAYKAGRFSESAAAAASHTGAMAGVDAVYEAAFQRAGIVRIFEVDDMFDCAELLARQQPPRGDRLAIITNAGGPGVMTTGHLRRAFAFRRSRLRQFHRRRHAGPAGQLGDRAVRRARRPPLGRTRARWRARAARRLDADSPGSGRAARGGSPVAARRCRRHALDRHRSGALALRRGGVAHGRSRRRGSCRRRLEPERRPDGALWARTRDHGLWRIAGGPPHSETDVAGCDGLGLAFRADGRPVTVCVDGRLGASPGRRGAGLGSRRRSDRSARSSTAKGRSGSGAGRGSSGRAASTARRSCRRRMESGDWRTRALFEDRAGDLWVRLVLERARPAPSRRRRRDRAA